MIKATKCRIRRANSPMEVYSKSTTPIGAGANGRFIQVKENEEVCIEKPFIYCFEDAVIETKIRQRDDNGKEVLKDIKVNRYLIDYIGFYKCTKKCVNGKCDGIEISREEFFKEDESEVVKTSKKTTELNKEELEI